MRVVGASDVRHRRGGLATLFYASLAVGSVVVVGVAGLAWGFGHVRAWWRAESAFLAKEQAAWPAPTPLAALATRSPDGRFRTTAVAYAERQDGVLVALAECPALGQLFTTQDHAYCETGTWCRRGDGVPRHERFALRLRWRDASHLDASWTELTGLDAEGHRTWGQRRQTFSVRAVKVMEEDSGPACDGHRLEVEATDTAPSSR